MNKFDYIFFQPSWFGTAINFYLQQQNLQQQQQIKIKATKTQTMAMNHGWTSQVQSGIEMNQLSMQF